MKAHRAWPALSGGLLFFAWLTVQAAPCRVAYDIGSSGIRAGNTETSDVHKTDIDYLKAVWSNNLSSIEDSTIYALSHLAANASTPKECAKTAGTFSAWRLAMQRQPQDVVASLTRIYAASAVPVLVIPQQQEGIYGFIGARQQLGKRLTTSHILDIGGGSLQVASATSAFGESLGQKTWHQLLCQELRQSANPACSLQPMSREDLARSRAILEERLAPLAQEHKVTSITAISRPVTQGIAPVTRKLTGLPEQSALPKNAITEVIARLAPLTPEAIREQTGKSEPFAGYLLSDMLLLEGILRVTEIPYIKVAEVELTNIPGLLADHRAFAWGTHYHCYLERLSTQGIEAAYASHPDTCSSYTRNR